MGTGTVAAAASPDPTFREELVQSDAENVF